LIPIGKKGFRIELSADYEIWKKKIELSASAVFPYLKWFGFLQLKLGK
jgi:hypothetical protein